MKILSNSSFLFILLIAVLVSAHEIQVKAYSSAYCDHESRCGARLVYCPAECPNSESEDPEDKVCRINCESPKCKVEFKRMIFNLLTPFVPYFHPDVLAVTYGDLPLNVEPSHNNQLNWDNPASGCYDPHSIGGEASSDFYFTLISDPNLQINARFRGHHPAGRTRDFSFQALGVLFDSHTFSLEATKSTSWDSEVDSLKFSYNGEDISVPTGRMSIWESPEESIKIERTSKQKSVIVTIPGVVEIVVNVMPVTNRIHGYKVPLHHRFSHLEVQFRFFGISDNKVEGMLGRIYQPDFENPAELGLAIPVVGEENKYSTSSLLSAKCGKCMFSPTNFRESQVLVQYSKLDCFSRVSSGMGSFAGEQGCYVRLIMPSE